MYLNKLGNSNVELNVFIERLFPNHSIAQAQVDGLKTRLASNPLLRDLEETLEIQKAILLTKHFTLCLHYAANINTKTKELDFLRFKVFLFHLLYVEVMNISNIDQPLDSPLLCYCKRKPFSCLPLFDAEFQMLENVSLSLETRNGPDLHRLFLRPDSKIFEPVNFTPHDTYYVITSTSPSFFRSLTGFITCPSYIVTIYNVKGRPVYECTSLSFRDLILKIT